MKLTEELENDSSTPVFPSIATLLRGSPVSYEDLLCHDGLLNQLLGLGIEKLDEVRAIKPDAAGLMVATNIEHARQVALALETGGESYRVVTNRTPDAQQVINEFKSNSASLSIIASSYWLFADALCKAFVAPALTVSRP